MAFISLDADPNPTLDTLRIVGGQLMMASHDFNKARYAVESYMVSGEYALARENLATIETALSFESLTEPSINGKTVGDRAVQTQAWLATNQVLQKAKAEMKRAEQTLTMLKIAADGAEQTYKALTHRLNGARAEATLLAAFANADTADSASEMV